MITTPGPAPVTIPAGLTVATDVLPLLQLPPEGVPVNGSVALTQTEVLPEITGEAFIVIGLVT